MTTWSDTFSRTVSSGWGTASDGETWSEINGTSTVSVGGNKGLIASPSSTVIMQLGSNTGKDMQSLVRWSYPTTNDQIGIFVRLTDATHYYRFSLNGPTGLQIGKKAGGSFTTIATASVPTAIYPIAASTLYWFRFHVVGTNLYGRIWADASVEPTNTWHITASDSSVTSGGVGLFANPTTTTADAFDSFSALTLNSQNVFGNHKHFGRMG